MVGCASNVRFNAGTYIFKEGEAADTFYLIRDGKVAVEIFAPQRKPIIVATLGEGEILGWSWLLPPYQWKFHARAMRSARHRARRQMSADQVRGEPRSRVRGAEALCPDYGAAAGGDAPAVARCLRGSTMIVHGNRSHNRPDAPAAVPGAARWSRRRPTRSR